MIDHHVFYRDLLALRQRQGDQVLADIILFHEQRWCRKQVIGVADNLHCCIQLIRHQVGRHFLQMLGNLRVATGVELDFLEFVHAQLYMGKPQNVLPGDFLALQGMTLAGEQRGRSKADGRQTEFAGIGLPLGLQQEVQLAVTELLKGIIDPRQGRQADTRCPPLQALQQHRQQPDTHMALHQQVELAHISEWIETGRGEHVLHRQ